MRYWLSCLLAISLLLRGLLGSAMAMSMAVQAIQPDAPAQASHRSMAATGHALPMHAAHHNSHAPEGQGHAKAAASPQAPTPAVPSADLPASARPHPPEHCADASNSHSDGCSSTDHSGTGSCAACSLCHAAADLPQLAALPHRLSLPAVPADLSVRFASATQTRLVKPPIPVS